MLGTDTARTIQLRYPTQTAIDPKSTIGSLATTSRPKAGTQVELMSPTLKEIREENTNVSASPQMRRPLTAYFSVQDPEKIQSGTMFHHENKGLRSEGKFKSYIDNVKKLRMTSENLLQKNVDMIDEMYSATPEKIKLNDFLEKTYLQCPKKDKNTEIKFTQNATQHIQEKKFKAMRRALDELQYEHRTGKKVIKYITNNSPPQANLMVPKFTSQEGQMTFKTFTPIKVDQLLTLEQALKNLEELNTDTPIETFSPYFKRQDTFEYKKEQLKAFQEKLRTVEKLSSSRRPLKVQQEKTETTDENRPKTMSQLNSNGSVAPKLGKLPKSKSKKRGIEKRIKATQPLEAFLKTNESELPTIQTPQSVKMNSPLSAANFDLSASKFSLNFSNVKSGALSHGGGIFINTQAEGPGSQTVSRMISPLKSHGEIDLMNSATTDDENMNTSKEDLSVAREKKIKRTLHSSQQARHIRIKDVRIAGKEKYNVVIDSFVSPENATIVMNQTKAGFFRDQFLDVRGKSRETASGVYFDKSGKTKAQVYTTYKQLSQICAQNAKETPLLKSSLNRKMNAMNEDFNKMASQLTEGDIELEIDNLIRQDVVNEMNAIPTHSFKLAKKPKRPATSYQKGQ